MRFVETAKLYDYILLAKRLMKYESPRSAYAEIEKLEAESIQSFSIESDRAFLREVSSVLNVIISIIYHPHIANKREEVVIRIEQAQQISEEAFRQILSDSRLWKSHGVKMIPEEVYHYQHIDELRIYENRFIGLLISMIDKELSRYSAFYLSKLPALKYMNVSLDDPAIGEIIQDIDRLKRKSQFLKNTYFYREVMKGKPISRKIQPTNILVKDRLYCYCYKFYRKFVRYEDAAETKRDLAMYYTLLILKEIKQQGFTLTKLDNLKKSDNRLVFENDEFIMLLGATADEDLRLTVVWKRYPRIKAEHLLIFRVDSESRVSSEEVKGYEKFNTVESVSLWDLSYTEREGQGVIDFDVEEQLVRTWLLTKLRTAPIDLGIYEKYCPVCRSKDNEPVGGRRVCSGCGSEYVFAGDGDRDLVWFSKIRK